jgi:hypothetical protein
VAATVAVTVLLLIQKRFNLRSILLEAALCLLQLGMFDGERGTPNDEV